MPEVSGRPARPAITATLLLLAVTAGIWWLWPGAADTSTAPQNASERHEGPSAESMAPGIPPYDPAGVPRGTSPLPSLDFLVSAASQGDARAACQLASEFRDCQAAHWLVGGPRLSEAVIAEQTSHLADAEPETRLAVMAPLRARLRCQQLGQQYGDRHFEWLRQAALAGQPEAAYRYVVGEAFGYAYGADFSFLRSPRFNIWRREAPQLLDALFRAGYPEALGSLLFAPDPLLGGHAGKLLPPDPLRERARLHLLVLLSGNSTEALEMLQKLAQVSPELDREASALARTWHLDYFGGRVFGKQRPEKTHHVPWMHAAGQSCSQPVPGMKR